VVDVSFNQLGGLFTLSFLEEVDMAIGGDHIFKRAIILVRRGRGEGGRQAAVGGGKRQQVVAAAACSRA
jgi:hypothetical protein